MSRWPAYVVARDGWLVAVWPVVDTARPTISHWVAELRHDGRGEVFRARGQDMRDAMRHLVTDFQLERLLPHVAAAIVRAAEYTGHKQEW